MHRRGRSRPIHVPETGPLSVCDQAVMSYSGLLRLIMYSVHQALNVGLGTGGDHLRRYGRHGAMHGGLGVIRQ
jgi:hypothetical protein